MSTNELARFTWSDPELERKLTLAILALNHSPEKIKSIVDSADRRETRYIYLFGMQGHIAIVPEGE